MVFFINHWFPLAFLNPYFLGGYVRGGRLTSHTAGSYSFFLAEGLDISRFFQRFRIVKNYDVSCIDISTEGTEFDTFIISFQFCRMVRE